MAKELLIIIPAYNEAKNINGVLDQLEKEEIASIADVLVMNDASSDGTNWIVKNRHHQVVTHVFNLGYGSAIQLGYKYAIRRNYQYVIQMDADGQHDVCNIQKIFHELKTPDEQGRCPDIVLGSRYMKESTPFETSLSKKIAYAVFISAIKMVTGRKIKDPTTGLQGLDKSAVLYYSKYNNFDERYPDANMLIQMLLLGYNIKEIPAVMHSRIHGKSMHSGLKPIGYMFHMFFSIIGVVFRYKILKITPEAGTEHYDFQQKEK
jgi:glycosyltransferase involved in cell wall biosynthesis